MVRVKSLTSQLISDADIVAGQAAEAGLSRRPGLGPAGRRFAPPDEAAAERLADHLRVENVRAHYEAARTVSGSAGTEETRKPLRALARLYLRRGAAEQEAELERFRDGQDLPAAGFETLLSTELDAKRRGQAYRRWLASEDESAALRAELHEAREDAARRAGARSVSSLLGAAHPHPPAQEIEAYERGAIAPLDDLVQRVARARRAAAGFADAEPADVLAVQGVTAVPSSGVTATSLRLLQRDLGGKWGGGEPLRIEDLQDRPWPTQHLARDGSVYVALGSVGGPAGLLRGLAEFGRACRAGFVAALRGTAALRFADPAFDSCGATLFRRLALCPAFRRCCGFAEGGPLAPELWFQEAVAPRLSWSYLQAVEQAADPGDLVFDRAIERATGGPATPAHRAEIADRDPRGAAELRGTVLGLLMEERLRIRFGRGWYASPRAMRWLHDAWEAEPDHTAEEMAAALDVGTIEPTPLGDACRPQGAT